MQNYKLYFSRLKNWLFDAFPFWLFLAVVVLAIGIPFLFQFNPVDHVYYTGFLLQFSAFLTIIIRINTLRKYFGDDDRDFIGLTLEWFKRLGSIFEKPKIVNLEAEGNITSHGESIAGVASFSDKPLEQRVADLEEKLKKLENNLRETESKLNRQIDENVNNIKKQIGKLKNKIRSSNKETKEFKADSLKFEIVWSIWLILGLTVRSFSEMIGSWFM